jgi:hypothetical protein
VEAEDDKFEDRLGYIAKLSFVFFKGSLLGFSKAIITIGRKKRRKGGRQEQKERERERKEERKKERQKERKNRDIREGGERERESYIIVIVILYF